VEVVLKSVVASPMVKYRAPFVLGMPAEALFDVDMIQKDMRLALDLAHATGVALPSVALTHELLTAAKGLGLAKYDFAILFDLLAHLSNLPPSKKL
jgi:3-hydroxyisobutyrate dehydrogenase